MSVLLPIGARFVLLNGAVGQVGLASAERGLDLQWRYGPGRYGIDHETYATETRSFSGIGLRPFSPVHLKAHRGVTGDIFLSWIRRTRIDGDSWAGLDVPLGEEMEAYQIDILDGLTVKRTFAASTQNVSYEQTDQITDFGNADFSSLRVRIKQLSQAFGQGSPQEALLHV